jgi:regulatory protein
MTENKTSSLNEALQKLQQICSRQEKCPLDVITLLKRLNVSGKHHHEIIEKLKSDNFINEQRYAASFIKDKIQFEHWGLIKISYFLKQKGISSTVINESIQQIDRDEYRQMIGKELAKKRKTLKNSPREIWAKLARYGSSRGYEMEMMREFLDERHGEL